MPSFASTFGLLALTATSALASPWNWGPVTQPAVDTATHDDSTDNHEHHSNHTEGDGPWGPPPGGNPWSQCLTSDQAQQVATAWTTLITNYSAPFANAVLAPNFTDYSESVNTLINECPQGSAAITLPLLSPTFTNRSSFELGQGQQAPINAFQLDIWNGCTSVTYRWKTTNTAPIPNVLPVVGIIVAEVIPAPAGNAYNGTEYPFLITRICSEFDAGAWLSNIEAAGFCANTTSSAAPTATATPKPSNGTSSSR